MDVSVRIEVEDVREGVEEMAASAVISPMLTWRKVLW